jgi:hypothetical protein
MVPLNHPFIGFGVFNNETFFGYFRDLGAYDHSTSI